jgi:hypothetical protein
MLNAVLPRVEKHPRGEFIEPYRIPKIGTL